MRCDYQPETVFIKWHDLWFLPFFITVLKLWYQVICWELGRKCKWDADPTIWKPELAYMVLEYYGKNTASYGNRKRKDGSSKGRRMHHCPRKEKALWIQKIASSYMMSPICHTLPKIYVNYLVIPTSLVCKPPRKVSPTLALSIAITVVQDTKSLLFPQETNRTPIRWFPLQVPT